LPDGDRLWPPHLERVNAFLEQAVAVEDAGLIDYLKTCPRAGFWNALFGPKRIEVGLSDFLGIVENHCYKAFPDARKAVEEGLIGVRLVEHLAEGPTRYDVVVILRPPWPPPPTQSAKGEE